MRNEGQHQRAAIKRDEDVTDVIAWVTERFIAEGTESTVADIAQALVMSEHRVRRALQDRVVSRDLVWSKAVRTSYSTHYRMFESGAHTVGVWGPRPTALARIIRELRKEESK
jgi:hypothetical protein